MFLTVCKTTDILDMDRGESEIVDLGKLFAFQDLVYVLDEIINM